MHLSNPFPSKVRNLFLYIYSCFDCGRSDRGLELHHIVGRKSNSALNAIPLCKDCHGKCGHSFKEQKKYFELNLRFLANCNDWTLTNKDYDFYTTTVQKHLQEPKR